MIMYNGPNSAAELHMFQWLREAGPQVQPGQIQVTDDFIYLPPAGRRSGKRHLPPDSSPVLYVLLKYLGTFSLASSSLSSISRIRWLVQKRSCFVLQSPPPPSNGKTRSSPVRRRQLRSDLMRNLTPWILYRTKGTKPKPFHRLLA